MVRGILFDLDGTLVDYRPPADPRALFDAGAARVYALLTANGCALPAFDQFCRRQWRMSRRADWVTWLTGGEPDSRRMLRRLCADYGLQRDQGSLALLGGLWFAPLAETATVAPDVIPTLTTLSDAGIKLGLVANTIWQAEVIDRHLEKLGLLELLRHRAYSTDHAARKPHPNLFRAALSEMNLPPDEVVFVGDEPAVDVAGARRVGMKTVLRACDPPARAARLADHLIKRISELTEIFDIVPEPPQRHEPATAMSLPPLNMVSH